jgi:hypothetical protein
MKDQAFVQLVHAMRVAQRRYFSTRLPSDLTLAKDAERAVDDALTRAANKTPLFDVLENDQHQIDPGD